MTNFKVIEFKMLLELNELCSELVIPYVNAIYELTQKLEKSLMFSCTYKFSVCVTLTILGM